MPWRATRYACDTCHAEYSDYDAAAACENNHIVVDAIAGLKRDLALAVGSRRAKTPKAVECEASQSGPAKQGNAQTPPSEEGSNP